MKKFALVILGAVLSVVFTANAAPPIFAALPFASCTDTTNDALSTSSETVFAANTMRAEACITNNSTTVTIYVARGATATANSDAVGPGGSWCIEVVQNAIYQGAISALAASGTPDIGGQECVK